MRDSFLLSSHFVAIQLPLFTIAYLTITAAIFGRRQEERGLVKETWLLIVATAACVLAAAAVPLLYRIIEPDSAILAWECESAVAYFGALAQGQSFRDFAWESIKANPGVLSASARSLYYGMPTFELFNQGVGGVFALRIVAFIAGLLSLFPAYCISKHVFNRGVALLFIAVLATNPLYLFYMGYGVSQTGTLLGFLIALALTLAAMKIEGPRRFVIAFLAGVAFFISMYNYSPERLFVVITVVWLIGYACYHLTIRRTNTGRAVAALIISVVVVGLLGVVKWLDPWSEFFTARGEQVFTMVKTRWMVASFLGNTPEVQSFDPENPSLLLQARFFLAVAKERFVEFISSMNPLYGSFFGYARGSHNATGFPLYQSSLIIPLLVGFAASLRSMWRARSNYLLVFFFLGLIPLLLTTRFDRHRAFFLLLPLSLWIAHGLYLCLIRFGATAIARVHIAFITMALGMGLIGNAWFYLAIPEETPPAHSMLANAASSLVAPNTGVALGLDCVPLAPLALKLMEERQSQSPSSYTLWEPEFGKFLTDQRMTTTRPEFLTFMEALSRGTQAILVTDQPTTMLKAEIETKGYSWTEERKGSFVITRVSQKP